MSSTGLYIHKGFFVQSKNGKVTDDYNLGKVRIFLFSNWVRAPMALYLKPRQNWAAKRGQ